MEALCVGLATGSGCAMTLAAVVVAFPEMQARKKQVKVDSCAKNCSILQNLIFCTVGVGLNIVAVRFGPVAVATPVQTGANLLSNMVVQTCLGIASYTKNQVVGTFILVSAVMMLAQVGPAEIPEDTKVTDLLLTAGALSFLSFLFLLLIASMSILASGRVKKNLYLVFLYALVGGADSVINTALSKVIQMDLNIWIKLPMAVVYAILAVVGVANGAQANGQLEDPSLFIPIGAAVQLILTCLAGIFIWGDWGRLLYRLTYVAIYSIVVLASYVVSEDDLLGRANLNVAEGYKEKVKNVAEGYKKIKSDPTAARGGDAPHRSFDADMHPTAPRGQFERRNTKSWKDHIKDAGYSTDDMIQLVEDAFEQFSPHTLSRPGFHMWLLERLESQDSQATTKSSFSFGSRKKEPLLEPSRGRRASCQCVIC